MLGIYVDDFKLAGNEKNISKGWEFLDKHIEFDAATPFGEFLGCSQFDNDVD